MKCLYINRDTAVDRRRNLGASFAAAAPDGVELVRVPAIEAGEVAAAAGALKPAERACWMSHLAALRWPETEAEDVLIVEDDTRFSPAAFATAPGMLAALPACDVLFTEVMPTNLALIAGLARQWDQRKREGNFVVHSLARTGFIGASAYVVRGAAKAKVLNALESAGLQDKPYDMALVELARTERIDARVCFPFLTAPSADADASQIQPDHVDLRQATLHAFRRLMFVDRDLEACRAEIGRLQARHGDEGAALAGGIFAALMSRDFPDSW
jgi:GR25 family glycosyltransferase involved in LPS biosynthesis